MIAIASASLLPVPSPNRLKPPQPRAATLTRSSARLSVVYSIESPVSFVVVRTYRAIRAVQTARRGRVHRQMAVAWLSLDHEHPSRRRDQNPALEADRPRPQRR